MTPELLQRVAKCAPEWMGAEFRTWRMRAYQEVVFTSVHDDTRVSRDSYVTLSNLDGNFNAQACFVMMDAIKHHPGFSEGKMYEGATTFTYECKVDRDLGYVYATGHGSTRTEAIVEAFLKVFEKEEA